MKSLFVPLLSLLVLAFGLGGCEKTAPPPDSKVLLQVVEDNVQAMEKKDLDAVMATVHSKGPYFQATHDAVAEVFQVLDLKYTLNDLQVVSASPDEAWVSFVQKTEKTGGEGEFQDNIQHGIHVLRPDDGKWKIYRTQVVTITGLDGKPLGAPETAAPEPPPAPSPGPASAAPPATDPPPKPPATTEKPAQ